MACLKCDNQTQSRGFKTNAELRRRRRRNRGNAGTFLLLLSQSEIKRGHILGTGFVGCFINVTDMCIAQDT